MKTFYAFILFICTSTSSNAQVIAGGYYHTLTICADSTVKAFGGNYTGQLGNGTTSNSTVPVSTSNLTSVIAVSAGDNFSMALKDDGTVWTWGNNGSGQLGIGNFTQSNIPVQVLGLTDVIGISAGGSHAIAVKSDGTLWTWGNNNSGQAGDNNPGVNSNVPTIVIGSANFIKVAAGGNHNISLKNDGTVWAMGSGTVGVLGTGSSNSSFVLIQSNTLPGVIDIASGQASAYAINADSTVSAWGYGVNGQLGNGDNLSSFSPILVNSLTQITHLASGFGLHAVARKADGTLWTWGHNAYGQLGDGTNIAVNSPVQLSAPLNMSEVAMGNIHSIAVKSDGTTWTWGSNAAGQIGNGSNVDTNVPGSVSGLCLVAIPCAVDHITDVVTACDSFTWINGVTYISSNNSATYLAQNMNGCDSIMALNLTINNSTTSSSIETGVDVFNAPSGTIYTTSGVYNDTIKNAAGCDSIITIDLTIKYSGLYELENSLISVYPNPTTDEVTINAPTLELKAIEVYDLTGKHLNTFSAPNFSVKHYANGVYYLIIHSNKDSEILKLIKQ